jgi:outer membrane protein insertion porin family/translocation and assembly module TamA
MNRLIAHAFTAACSAAAICVAAAPAAAQRNPCTARHPLVDDVRFNGTDRIPKGDVALEASTERTGIWRRWFGWKIGTLTCLDSAEVLSDAKQIEALYHERGFVAARVTPTVTRHGDRRAIVTFTVREGTPLSITSVTVTGLPREAGDSAAVARTLLGTPLNDSIVGAIADSLQASLRDVGYARALPNTVNVRGDTVTRRGAVDLGFTPGAVTWIGVVNISVTPNAETPALREPTIRRIFGVKPGDRFNARRIASGQRALASLELYRQVRVDTNAARMTRGGAGDTIDLAMTLVEGERRRARVTAGWGTLDCFRTQGRLVEQNLAGLGHRLELNARLSKIGLGDPFSGLESLCATRVRDDPFSQRLNYYTGATLRPRGLFAWDETRWQPELTLFSERRSSVGAYEQTTEIGALASTTHSLTDWLTATLQYSYTDSRTRADRAVSCTRFGFCRLEDVASFVLRSPQHSVGASFVFNPLLPTDDPISGYRWVVDAKFGHASIGKILPIDFGRVTAEFASYTPLSEWLTVAVRAQIGAVISPADRSFLLPPAERFYSGGQNSVRGYGQNLLGPGSYIVTAVDTIAGPAGTLVGAARAADDIPRIAPSGGNAMWIANLELRTRRGWPNDLLRWVLFLDAGRVWNTRDVFSVTNADARATPGIGVRLVTPLGPFRVDIGYNPNSLDAGPAFLVIPGDAKAGIAGRAVCVSPGTDDPLVLGSGTTSSSSSCPATFLPTASRSLLSRLTFHFSLGNAF